MLFVDSSRDISKKSLRIDLFDFFNLLKIIKKYAIIRKITQGNKENEKQNI